MITVHVEITGTSPLLINRFTEEAQLESKTTKIKVEENRNPREIAEKSAYIAEDGTYYFSSYAIPRAMGEVGLNYKQKSNRKTLKFVVPSAVRMIAETVTILDGDVPASMFEIDARSVVIPATKGRIMRYRPRFNQWNARFDLFVNDGLMDVSLAHKLLQEAGQQIGIGDFRPEKRGPFGCFRVTKWQEEA